MTDQTTAKTIGDNAAELHERILSFISGRGTVECMELRYEVGSMSGHGGAAASALASVAIHQLERDGRIELTKSGKSWRIAEQVIFAGRPEIGRMVNVRMPEHLIADIDAEAEREGVKRAEWVRRMLYLGVAQTR